MSAAAKRFSRRYASSCVNGSLLAALPNWPAVKANPRLVNQPITSVDNIWKRLMKLFESEIGDNGNFRNLYEVLSICVDVGNLSETRGELEYLAAYFGKSPAELDRAIAQIFAQDDFDHCAILLIGR
jgi:hypothetical protein